MLSEHCSNYNCNWQDRRMTQFNWTCPHCHHPQIVTEHNRHVMTSGLSLTELNIGDVAVKVTSIACLNGDCLKLALNVSLYKWDSRTGKWGTRIDDWRLMPQSDAVAQPDYI